ncbi:MAG: C40 family peptidase [Novosphingobium sp.]
MTAATPPSSGQYALAGPGRVHDRRVTPIRGDLADIALAGRLFVPHYVVPLEKAVSAAFAPLHATPRDDAEQTSELLRGERFLVLEIAGSTAWGYCAHDRYVGYLRLADLGEPVAIPPPPPPDGTEPAASAENLVGTPYVWGGRGGEGVDCSGMIQTIFARAGHALPRDSDQQAASAGTLLGADDPLARGDLVFFPGHVGILRDPGTLIHASLERGRVVVEQLAEVIDRKGPVSTVRRVG